MNIFGSERERLPNSLERPAESNDWTLGEEKWSCTRMPNKRLEKREQDFVCAQCNPWMVLSAGSLSKRICSGQTLVTLWSRSEIPNKRKVCCLAARTVIAQKSHGAMSDQATRSSSSSSAVALHQPLVNRPMTHSERAIRLGMLFKDL